MKIHAMSERNNELSEALQLIDVETWLDSEGIKYKKARGARGAQLNVKECPCCGNSNWKVYLNVDSGLGNCFHGDCEKKFNRWSFFKASLPALSDRELAEYVKRLAGEAGWRPPKRVSSAVSLERSDLTLPESIELPYEGRNLKYLENRNISSEMAKYFHLRYSANGSFNYIDDGRRRSQDYSSRVIIPIFDLDGNLVSFQGRDTLGTADKKYLFPPGFSATGSTLYNANNAVGAKRIVINEGVFDVIATKIALDQDMNLRDVVPVGSFGKHLSVGDDKSQMAKLMRLKESGLEQITLMWDSEARALSDAADTALKLRGMGFSTRVAVLPTGKDPNEVPASDVIEAFWKATSANTLSMAKLKMTFGK